MRRLTEIIIHCTATPNNWRSNDSTSAKVAEVKLWHTRDRGWSDIGYHYLIDRDGTLANGRSMSRDGAHVKGRNKNTVGISLFGGIDSVSDGKFSDNFTPEQESTLRAVIRDLRQKYPSIKIVSGHNQYAAKACPGFHVPTWLRETETHTAPVRPDVPPVENTAPAAKNGGLLALLLRLISAIFGRKTK